VSTDRVTPAQALRRALLAAALAVALTSTGCTDGVRERVEYPESGITIASGSSQGVYHGYAEAYRRAIAADLPGLKVRVEQTSGSLDNLDRLGRGSAHLGFATADTAYLATDRRSTAAPTRNLRAIARIYDEYLHLVVPAASPVQAAKDLHALRVSTGADRSSTELTAGRVLKAARLDVTKDLQRRRLGLDDSIAALRAGTIDAFFFSGGLPTPGIRDLAKTMPIRLVRLGDQVSDLRTSYGAIYRRGTVSSSTYENVDQTDTVGVPNYLVVSGDLDDRLVYELTAVLFRHRGRIGATVPSGRLLDARSAISTMPIPLHDGAKRYYRDTKN
jgi:uncharacterized protein